MRHENMPKGYGLKRSGDLLTWYQMAPLENDDFLKIIETPAKTYSLYYVPKGTLYEPHSWSFLATYPSELAAMVGAEIWEMITRTPS